MHTYMHTRIHAYIHAYIRTSVRTTLFNPKMPPWTLLFPAHRLVNQIGSNDDNWSYLPHDVTMEKLKILYGKEAGDTNIRIRMYL